MNHQPIRLSFVLTDLGLPELSFRQLPTPTRNQITLVVGKKLLREKIEWLLRQEDQEAAKAIRFTRDMFLNEVPLQTRIMREVLKNANYGPKVISNRELVNSLHDLVMDYCDYINKALDEGLLEMNDPIPSGWLPSAGKENRMLALRALAKADRAVVEYNDPDEYLTLTLTIGYTPAERQERLRTFRQPTVGEAILDLVRRRFKRSKPRNF